ncbi:MAG: Holliday junction branch migration protein RuvA [Balneola sp.]|jgi:Holliday junction DNA helicase RuvA|tara:strand:- start:21628 stop:22215 length:588 start_codon:yes stop_codon:yes gene_type:complete
MITFLKGYVEELEENKAHLDVGGVGYGVEISKQTLAHLKKGIEVKLLIHHHITDSDQRLFGFYAKDEMQLFEKLITVKGVGPKLGITIVSGLPADHLIGAIKGKDAASLSRVPGIGKKTAERIILELKDKLDEVEGSGSISKPAESNMTDEVVSALESLGFKKREAEEAAVKALQGDDIKTVPAAIKKGLSLLNK